MAHKSLLPKQRALTENESETSFDSWVESMTFHISLSDKSARFLSAGDLNTWTTAADRGFNDDTGQEAGVNDSNKMNKHAKASLLSVILGSIAGYAPVISSRFIKHQSTSLESIWKRLRSYYGFRRTGSRILDLFDSNKFDTKDPKDREKLWEDLYQFLEDQLLTPNGGISHENVKQEQQEEFTPTLLNTLVTIWLHTINPALPVLVKQRFSTQLRSSTVYTIREEISDAIPVLLSELEEKECSINRSGFSYRNRYQKPKPSTSKSPKPCCCLCKASNRQPMNHYLSTCPFLPPEDKKYLTRAREITLFSGDEQSEDEEPEETEFFSKNRNISYKDDHNSASFYKQPSSIRKVDVDASPLLAVSVNGFTSHFTLDSGAEASVIEESECIRLGLNIKPTSHRATQGDGKTPLDTIGEVHFIAHRGHHKLEFSGIVVKCADSPVLAGAAFHRINKLSINYGLHQILIDSCCKIKYDPVKKHRKSSVKALKINKQTCILPGDSISFQLPEELSTAESVAIEPRTDVPKHMPDWIQCSVLQPDADGSVTIRNSSSSPVLLSKHTTPCQARPTVAAPPGPDKPPNHKNDSPLLTNTPSSQSSNTSQSSYSEINTTSLAKEEKATFSKIHKRFQSVFSPGIGLYNGNSGKFSHVINMNENLPPQRKGRVPDYSKGDKDHLQERFDMLLKEGVMSRAEDINQPVEYVHPSFLVKKPSGGHRLVTSFGEMAEYAKPQPTVTTNIEHALHALGQFEEIIVTDLKDSYYQIPLDPDSSKFVGVVTPYSGTYVYRRSVMGLPGSEAALDELLSRIFGDLIKEGKMVKVADDLFLGSKDSLSLAKIWEEVLDRLQANGLKLSPGKTNICPQSATILGWEWRKGSISPGQHRINALTMCDPPSTVKSLRSFLGCYKFLSRVIPCYAEFLQPLEQACAGKESSEKVVWSEELLTCFKRSKEQLSKIKPIVLPKRDEQLHIVTDACETGIAGTLYVVRNSKLKLAGYFSAAIKKTQSKLLPCELEALAISASIKHYSHFIVQSTARTRIMTDSRPCVLSYKKLLRNQFSSSPKVTTFLATAARYGVEILHISGNSNLFSDFASRNPVECNNPKCGLCSYIDEECNAAVGEVTVSDIVSGKAKVPYATKSSWLEAQRSCPTLSQVYHHLKTGSTVPKKRQGFTDVKRYITCGTTYLTGQNEGLLVVKQSVPFKPTNVRIVIPRGVSEGLLTALHLNMNHPSVNQLKIIFSREFFCLDMDSIAKKISDQCYTCASLKKLPAVYHQQSTSIPEKIIGSKFSADVVNRHSQCILLLREDITSYTVGTIIKDEKADTLKDGLLLLTSQLRPPNGPPAIVRTDPASGLRSLANNKSLEKFNLTVELGDEKNINKNPVAESSIQELHLELKKLQPLGGKVTETTLARALSSMNSLVRGSNYSASEAWTKRDMKTGNPLDINDNDLIQQKYHQRLNCHQSSAKYKSRGKTAPIHPEVEIGQLTFLYSDSSKLKSRDKYIITAVEKENVWVQKFTKNQFRSRQYRVKKSNLILIPRNEPQLLAPNNCTPPKARKKQGIKSPLKVEMMMKPSVYVTNFSSSDDSDDEFYHPSNMLANLHRPHGGPDPVREGDQNNDEPFNEDVSSDATDYDEEQEDLANATGHAATNESYINWSLFVSPEEELNHEDFFEVHLSADEDNIIIHPEEGEGEPTRRVTRSQTAKAQKSDQ